MKNNEIVLNIPADPFGELPHPDEHLLLLNGHPLEGIRSIKIKADINRATTVTIELYAQVYGAVNAPEGSVLVPLGTRDCRTKTDLAEKGIAIKIAGGVETIFFPPEESSR